MVDDEIARPESGLPTWSQALAEIERLQATIAARDERIVLLEAALRATQPKFCDNTLLLGTNPSLPQNQEEPK